jgi:hypothetical protein
MTDLACTGRAHYKDSKFTHGVTGGGEMPAGSREISWKGWARLIDEAGLRSRDVSCTCSFTVCSFALPSFSPLCNCFRVQSGYKHKKQAVSLSRAIFYGAIGFSSLARCFLDARTAEEIIETPTNFKVKLPWRRSFQSHPHPSSQLSSS